MRRWGCSQTLPRGTPCFCLQRGARRARPWQRLLRGQGTEPEASEAGVIPVLVPARGGGSVGATVGLGPWVCGVPATHTLDRPD